MMSWIEKVFERALWESRFMVLLAVVASLLSALVLVLLGTIDVILVIEELLHAFSGEGTFEAFQKDSVTRIISAIDAYLISTVLLIFGIGLYELFISKIDFAERESRSSKILIIHSLDQLKEKLAKVIIMVLIVTFFKHAVNLKYPDPLSLLILSGGIILISLAVWFTHRGGAPESPEDIPERPSEGSRNPEKPCFTPGKADKIPP